MTKWNKTCQSCFKAVKEESGNLVIFVQTIADITKIPDTTLFLPF